jgi:hypothetical protein
MESGANAQRPTLNAQRSIGKKSDVRYQTSAGFVMTTPKAFAS